MGRELRYPRFGTVLLWTAGLLMIYPFFIMVIIAFRTAGEAYLPLLGGAEPTVRNFVQVLSHRYFVTWYTNTITVVVLTIVCRLALTIPAAYAFSRMTFPGRTVILALLLATLMVPGEATMVSRYLYYKQLNLLDTAWVIVLPETAEVFYLMLLSEFFRSIPKDFTEAAHIDGAGHSTILTRICMPLSVPVLATTLLFSFIHIWNNFLDPYLFITKIARQLITPALQFFQEQGGANVPVQLAGSTLALVPVIALFIFTQKYFVAGVSSSGIKG